MEAQLILHGGRVVNVYTREILTQDVAIGGGRIVYVGPNAGPFGAPSTTLLDVSGKVVVPGFVDGHTHADYFLTIPSLLQALFRTGTTAIFTEIHAVTSAFGPDASDGFWRPLPSNPSRSSPWLRRSAILRLTTGLERRSFRTLR